jgi:hypothetical protein
MPRAKKLPQAQIVGDAVIQQHYATSKNYSATARFFNKGQANVYPSLKQVIAAVERMEAGTSAAFWMHSVARKCLSTLASCAGPKNPGQRSRYWTICT